MAGAMKLGAAIWPFRWDPPYEEPIRRVAALGFEAVELIIWGEGGFEYFSDRKVEELAALLADEGLELSQLVHTPRGMASPDPERRRTAVAGMRRAADIARRLGAGLVNSVAAYPFDLPVARLTERPAMQAFTAEFPRDADWARNHADYAACVRECAEIVGAAGRRYTLEAHPFRWMSNAASMLRLLEAVDSEFLGINFDPSHHFAVGDLPRAAIGQLGDRVFHCDLSDNDGTCNMQWRPGEGKIDWDDLLAALGEVGYEGVLSLELIDVPGVARWGLSSAGPLPPGAYRGHQPVGDPDPSDATAEFDEEAARAIEFLRAKIPSEGSEPR